MAIPLSLKGRNDVATHSNLHPIDLFQSGVKKRDEITSPGKTLRLVAT
jgi:hypothetical protein